VLAPTFRQLYKLDYILNKRVSSLRSLGVPLALLIIFLLFTVFPIVHADRGGFTPYYPDQERVSESGQKAIIAWNGAIEILVLSTDVKSNNETEVVEIMPLPSNPTISKGEKQTFLKVQQLVNTYLAMSNPTLWLYVSQRQTIGGESYEQNTPKITITFQEMIGVHYLTVVRSEETNDLIQWLKAFLRNKGYNEELPSNLDEILQYYVQNGMNFFAIDMIRTNSTVRTIDTLVYEFSSPKLYYPLRISALFSGNTEISLFTITDSELNENSITREGFVKKAQFQIEQETLAEISTNMTKLFSSNPYICYFNFKGSINSFNADILADFKSGPDIPTVTLATLSLGSGLMFLLLLFPMIKVGCFRRGKRSSINN